jgi:hypothetical protein
MSILAFVAGVVLIITVLVDAYESVILPRRVTRKMRLVRLFFRTTWWLWTGLARALPGRKRRENFLSYYGPLSLLVLLVFWASVLIAGFALLYWAPGNAVTSPEGAADFGVCLYLSGSTFFTLGIGDIVPAIPLARAFVVLEAGMGIAFLAIVIGFLPAISQSFSRREVNISLLDARAGSPPTAAEMLRRLAEHSSIEPLNRFFQEWELWCAELLESHLSFPVLVYFRSQHGNQSWLAALTSILDACAFAIANVEGESVLQARLTFAMARHAVADLALVLHVPVRQPAIDRLPLRDFTLMRSMLRVEGLQFREEADAAKRLGELRRMYEPYIHALSLRLLFPVPPWIREENKTDNWQNGVWEKNALFTGDEPAGHGDEGHF